MLPHNFDAHCLTCFFAQVILKVFVTDDVFYVRCLSCPKQFAHSLLECVFPCVLALLPVRISLLVDTINAHIKREDNTKDG